MAARKTQSRATRRIPPLIAETPEEIEEEVIETEPEEKGIKLPTFDPGTHVAVPHETLNALLQAKADLDQRSLAQAEADSKKVESLVMGFSTNHGMLQDQLARAYLFGNEQRDEASRLRERVSEKEMQIANMIRASEDAKLERERLAAEIERSRVATQRLQMELEARLRQREIELTAVRSAAAPVFAAAGKGLEQVITAWGPKLIGAGLPPGPGTQPAAPDSTNGAPNANAPKVRLNPADTDVWKQAFLDVFVELGPEGVACLRAITCSTVFAAQAPPLPSDVKGRLLGAVMMTGDDKVQALLKASSAAYVAEPQPATSEGAQPAPN